MVYFICRTCLKANLSEACCKVISNNKEANQMSIKDMLETFMPEMDLDIFEEEVVLCLECSEALQSAYIFKNKCLKTEEKIYDYLHRYNIKLGKKISLNNIVDYKTTIPSFDSGLSNYANGTRFLPDTLPEFLPNNVGQMTANNTDSSQSSSELFISDFPQIPSDNYEQKAILAFQKAKKRKNGENDKSNKKICDYSSLKRSYTCDQCEYKAYRLDLLNSHKLKHDRNMLNIKEYKCELCMYSTLRKRALDRHLFTHKGNSQHACEICNKTFAENYQLKLHAITHTGQELPHKCQECGKGYLTKSYLKQHVETKHLAKEKSVCQICPKEKCEHLFIRCYKCNLCESSFSDKRGLDAHKFTHTGGDLPYKCLHCNFSTAWKGNLKKHLQNKH